MLRGLYTATSGMITQQRKHDAITNNIANLNTPGFKKEHAVSRSFPEMLIQLMNGGDGQAAKPIGSINTGVIVEEIIAAFTQGDVQETSRPSDFALIANIAPYIEGDTTYYPQAFFTVQHSTDNGMRFTRNGQFQLNDGELMTAEGHRVLGRDGEPIRLDDVWVLTDNEWVWLGQRSLEQVKVGADGVMYDAQSGAPLQRVAMDPDTGQPLIDPEVGFVSEPVALLISQIDDPYRLVREGNGLFRLNDIEQNPPREVENMADVSVMQGFIERSNVDPTEAMVDMMTAQRLYEANQRVVQFYDRSLEKAVNEIGKV